MVEKQEKCNYPQIPFSPDRTRSKGLFQVDLVKNSGERDDDMPPT
jgi:hypothetical protein